jgi:cytochrome b561
MILDAARRISRVLFWIFLAVSIAGLSSGWAGVHGAFDENLRRNLRDLHVSLGFVGALIIAVQILIAIASLFSRGAQMAPGPRRLVSIALRQLAYLSFLLLIFTGAGDVVLSGEMLFVFQFPLPYVGIVNLPVADLLHSIHPTAAYLLALAILLNLLEIATVLFLSKRQPSPPKSAPVANSIQLMIVDNLTQSLRFFGKVGLWTQLIIALLSTPLLAFSYVGHTVSPNQTSMGDTIYWATGGLVLLFLSIFFQSFYAGLAKVIRSTPERYLGAGRRRNPFWFLAPSALVSMVGILASFVGIGLSVALLIGKTVSQPPGIAITDPQKIIRALDVFLLLTNFNLLFAHFIGGAITSWLTISGLRARHQYHLSAADTRFPIPTSSTPEQQRDS